MLKNSLWSRSEISAFDITSNTDSELPSEKDALTKEYNLFIMQKNTEIDALAEALKKTSPQYKWLYFAGGILFGTASSYAAYRALK